MRAWIWQDDDVLGPPAPTCVVLATSRSRADEAIAQTGRAPTGLSEVEAVVLTVGPFGNSVIVSGLHARPTADKDLPP